MIQVCCAIIIKDSMILAVQHGANASHPFLWEFPGGKIKPDETEEQCIIREIKEELSVEINVISRITSVEYNYGNKLITLIPFLCTIDSEEIILHEHVARQWFKIDDWQKINWLEADRELIILNFKTLKSCLDSNNLRD
jgi:8-oxo-dGTP diphosphatase